MYVHTQLHREWHRPIFRDVYSLLSRPYYPTLSGVSTICFTDLDDLCGTLQRHLFANGTPALHTCELAMRRLFLS